MKRAVCIVVFLCMLFSLSACGHAHEWKEATCTEPRTCKTCGATEGDPLGHSWQEATCTKPRTCSVCGETQGKPNGHVEGVWKTVNKPTLTTSGKEELTCTVCGEVLDTRYTTKTIKYSGGEFNFTRSEFVDFIIDHTNSDYRISDTGKDYSDLGVGHGYSVYNTVEGKLYAVLSMNENSSGNVTEVNVWGDINSLLMALHVYRTMLGEDVDVDAVINGLDRSRSYTYGGLKLSYTEPEKDYYVFKIKGS